MSETQKTIITMEDFSFPVWPLRPLDGDANNIVPNINVGLGHANEGDRFTDDLICVCGNTASDDGYIYCSRDGKQFEPSPGDWDGLDIDGSTVACASCWRVLDTTPVRRAMSEDEQVYWADQDAAWPLDDQDLVLVNVLGTVGNPALPPKSMSGFVNRFMLAVAYDLTTEGFDPVWIDHGMGHQVVYIPSFFSDGTGIDLDNSDSNDGEIVISKCDYVNDDGSKGPLDPTQAHLDINNHDFGDGLWDSRVVAAKYPYEAVAAIKSAKATDTLPAAVDAK